MSSNIVKMREHAMQIFQAGLQAVDPMEAIARYVTLKDNVLLIGDKVVHNDLADFDIEIDLGGAWKSLTGLPFVFAVWAADRNLNTDALSPMLERLLRPWPGPWRIFW